MKQSRFEGLNGVMAIGFGKRFSRLRIKIFQFLRLTAEIYGCFTAFNPIKTLRFAWGKILFSANSCERQSTVSRVKEIWKKGGFQY